MWQRNRKQIGLALTATLVVAAGTLIFTADWGGNGNTVAFEGNGSEKVHAAAPEEPEVSKRPARHGSRPGASGTRGPKSQHPRNEKGPRHHSTHGKPISKKAKKKPPAA